MVCKRDNGFLLFPLDLGKLAVRNKVRGVTSNEELDRIFAAAAVTEKNSTY
jgi:hypothetical protein